MFYLANIPVIKLGFTNKIINIIAAIKNRIKKTLVTFASKLLKVKSARRIRLP